jgi:hypothetical protein
MHTLKKRLLFWAIAITALLMIPLVAMQFTNEVQWSFGDFVMMGSILFGIGLAYELIARKSEKTKYRVAFGIGLFGAFLLFWVNGAVGIIVNEDQSPNLLYGFVLLVGIIGSFMSQFKAKGMASTMFATALVQMLVPVIALIIWPPTLNSWSPSVLRVFLLSAFFALLFVISAMLFKQSSEP